MTDVNEPFMCVLMLCFATETKFVMWVIGTALGLAIMAWAWELR